MLGSGHLPFAVTDMKSIKRSHLITGLAFVLLGLTGCSSTTTLRLTGTPGTKIAGHYRVSGALSDFSGTVPAEFDLAGLRLEECEFRKDSKDGELVMEIEKGHRQRARVVASPGSVGVRATRDGSAWKTEALR